jgi:polyferredoxin
MLLVELLENKTPTKERKMDIMLIIKKFATPGIIMIVFWVLGIVMWQTSGYLQPLFFFGYIGTALGIGLGLYSGLTRAKKQVGRRVSLFLIGLFLFVFATVIGKENMQIEGLFFGLLTGVVQAAVFHYFIAKIFGPLIFGRLWCGWACWTAMILDLLPYTQSPGRLPKKFGWLRYFHFFLSLGIALVLVFGFEYHEGAAGQTAVAWFLIGNALYYFIGIILAFILKDNRAFCKYVCPITLPLKITSRFSLLKIKGNQADCNNCQTCSRKCPMDIRVADYIQNNQRVLSTECTLCQTCVSSCPKNILKIGFGFDIGGNELLSEISTGKEI